MNDRPLSQALSPLSSLPTLGTAPQVPGAARWASAGPRDRGARFLLEGAGAPHYWPHLASDTTSGGRSISGRPGWVAVALWSLSLQAAPPYVCQRASSVLTSVCSPRPGPVRHQDDAPW